MQTSLKMMKMKKMIHLLIKNILSHRTSYKKIYQITQNHN